MYINVYNIYKNMNKNMSLGLDAHTDTIYIDHNISSNMRLKYI